MSRRTMLVGVVGAVVLMLGGGVRGSIVEMDVFGDSLSDTGNVYIATGGETPSSTAYYQGRFSNGPVWVEYLAGLLKVPVPTPSLVGGTNYAFGGAQAAGGADLQPPTLLTQAGMYLADHTPSPDHLYIVWGGANDGINGQADPTVPAGAVVSVVDTLARAGARQFLVADLIPLGQTPAARGTIVEEAADLWAAGYNLALEKGLADFEVGHPEADVHLFSANRLFSEIAGNTIPQPFTNITDSAMNVAGANADTFLFWDGIHPTTAAHRFFAEQAYSTVVPEPMGVGVVAMWAIGLVGRPRRGGGRG